MQENEIGNLTINEIKQMLLVTINNDSYEAKCFIELIIEKRYNNEKEREILKEAKKLLNELKTKEVLQLIYKL